MGETRWIQTIETQSATEFIKKLSPHRKPFCFDRNWLYRGHADAGRYQLIPSALRIEEFDNCRELANHAFAADHWKDYEAYQVLLEIELIDRFLGIADECGLTSPDLDASTLSYIKEYRTFVDELVRLIDVREPRGEVNELEEWIEERTKGFGTLADHSWPIPHVQRHLALARHNDIPTRLLDWSYSSKVAAYFAATVAAKDVWDNAGQNQLMEVWAFSRFANKWDDQPHIDHWVESIRVPNALNNRMAAQRGCFTTLKVPPKKLLQAVDRRPADQIAIESMSNVEGSIAHLGFAPIVRVQAPIEISPEVLWLLDREGVARHFLFPEFSSVVLAMQDQARQRIPRELE